jgi:hypothetical protein
MIFPFSPCSRNYLASLCGVELRVPWPSPPPKYGITNLTARCGGGERFLRAGGGSKRAALLLSGVCYLPWGEMIPSPSGRGLLTTATAPLSLSL